MIVALAGILVVEAGAGLLCAGPYVTEPSGIRWNDVGGLEWSEVGGAAFSDLYGIRWNDVGGIRWNDVGSLLLTDAQGIRWNDVGGIRWNDVGSLEFEISPAGVDGRIDLELLQLLGALPNSSTINVVVSYHEAPGPTDLADLLALGVSGGTIFRRLPMVVINATKSQITAIASLPAVRSVFSNRATSFFDTVSNDSIGVDELVSDPYLAVPGGGALTGLGVTIAVVDTGVDGTHPDLPYESKVVDNVRLSGAIPTGFGFVQPTYARGIPNTDLVLGHGTFVASVAAGSGAGSDGAYAGVAPGASILSLSAGDLFIVHVLEAFDYILVNAQGLGVRVVNCSWGTQGWFDPDDPVNIASRALHDAGLVVVFAAGNHGPAPDSLNPYSLAPWVVGVGSTRLDGRLSRFSSRGIYEELLHHPTLVAPGEGIIGALASGLPAVSGVAGVADPAGGRVVPPQDAALYTASSGTSFAAPHVAGVIALMLEAEPDLGPVEVRRILQATATPQLLEDRSAVGAGRLDAWAAVSQAVDPDRPFGRHVADWMDERPYTIQHLPAGEQQLLLPASGVLELPVAAPPGSSSWQLTVAWGDAPGLADIDVRVRDGAGVELVRSETINGLGLFGRVEGLRLARELGAAETFEIFFKDGTGLLDEELHVRQEAAVPVLHAYSDVASLDPADVQAITTAVSRNLIVGHGTVFEPLEAMSRGDLARSLALAAGVPQRIPPAGSFVDVAPTDTNLPYVESVAGRRAQQLLLEGQAGNRFRATQAVRRIDFAAAMVRAAGLEQEAVERAGETLAVVDDDRIPDRLKGYAAIALERGLIEPVSDPAGAAFAPTGKVLRLEVAKRLLVLQELSSGTDAAGESDGAPIRNARPRPGDRPASRVRARASR